ncbi:cytochrome P450 [Sphingobium phenoxybenzoativorans]|uniref:Cytochrome P450 n=1 Tax=Sphingobium phenoxybenzoativorans TaxID=1592790 RepID=A0A975K8Q1_9SPHN|nr:cytochrome P450 [Sphingobium phenoxybenzoativorans]QUT06863.1 cytochrome P450 [Sphingobium phenoxybenzoativorans]
MAVDELTYDPSDPAIRRNPHPIFSWLRREDPVHWSDPMSGWIVTGYDDILEGLTDSSTFSAERLTNVRKHLPANAQSAAGEVLRYLNSWMVFRDPPDHTRLRRHMASVLNLPSFETLRGTISELTNDLLDKLPDGDVVDMFSTFSILLPGMVIMELMGVERGRLLEVKSWSDDMMLFIGSARGVPDKYERAKRGAVAMATLFKEAIGKRRADPKDDVLSQLIASEVDGRSLNDDELVGCLMMVLNGGHETTANLINNSLLALAHNPDTTSYLRGNLDKMEPAVEEFLRYDSPILSIGRVVKEDIEMGGKQLSAGERVFFMLLSANRDEEVFEDPTRLDVTRSPNPHMAFGKGPHFCLGTPLARIEGQIVLGEILRRYSSIELAEPVDSIPWINSLVTRGPSRLPLRLRK